MCNSDMQHIAKKNVFKYIHLVYLRMSNSDTQKICSNKYILSICNFNGCREIKTYNLSHAFVRPELKMTDVLSFDSHILHSASVHVYSLRAKAAMCHHAYSDDSTARIYRCLSV